jgi:hypothetical protein
MSRAALFYRKRSDSIGKPLRCLAIFYDKSSLEAVEVLLDSQLLTNRRALTELSCKAAASTRVVLWGARNGEWVLL